VSKPVCHDKILCEAIQGLVLACLLRMSLSFELPLISGLGSSAALFPNPPSSKRPPNSIKPSHSSHQPAILGGISQLFIISTAFGMGMGLTAPRSKTLCMASALHWDGVSMAFEGSEEHRYFGTEVHGAPGAFLLSYTVKVHKCIRKLHSYQWFHTSCY
jgi:hypothetical protein